MLQGRYYSLLPILKVFGVVYHTGTINAQVVHCILHICEVQTHFVH